MRALRRAALLTCAALVPVLAADPAPSGLWIHHDEWEFAPQEFNEPGDIRKSASAAVVNFCPRGDFRMATGVIYQSTRSPGVVIGASDGLSIYRGRWAKDGASILVQYRLVSAEFANLLQDPVASRERQGAMQLADGRLNFPFTTHRGNTWAMRLLPAARYEKKVADDFVSCGAKPH